MCHIMHAIKSFIYFIYLFAFFFSDDISAQEEIVYGINATSLSTKYKKLRNSTLSD